MTNSLPLLQQSHDTAVRTIIQEALKPGITLDDLLVGQYEIGPDGKVIQPVYIDSDAYNNPDWPYRGSVEMSINRLDLHQALGHLGLRFRLSTDQYKASAIVNRLQAILQLHFDPSDYIEETLTVSTASATVTLRASEDSPRWKGQVDIFVYR